MTESHKDAARDEVYALNDHDTPEAEWDTEDAFDAPAPLYRNRWAESRHDGEQFDLEERASLRRVAGLSTELEDVTEVEYRQLRLERVVLVGVWTDGTAADAELSLRELAALAETAGSEVLEGVVQRREKPDPATYIGSGKAQELRDIVVATGADTVICDGELSPGQLIHLEDVVKVKVIDRTALILDIFAQHAKSREGKAQVALAQMQYMLPRLRGWGQSLSRQMGGGRGGLATRGPGETKIETDRRRIRERMAKLRREIGDMSKGRQTKRAERRRGSVPSVVLAGYTNAGKSSLLNRLTGAGVLVENALFATLDPTVRRTETATGRAYTLSDTVGFVRHLPHQLVEAFRSTLEEVGESDLVLHVVDASDEDPEGQISAVRAVFADMGAGDVKEADGLQQGRPRRPRGPGPPAPPRAAQHRGLGPHRRGHRQPARRHRTRPAPPRRRARGAGAVRPRRPGRPHPRRGRDAEGGAHRPRDTGPRADPPDLAAQLEPFRTVGAV